MEFREHRDFGEGMSIDTHMMNTAHGGRECQFVNLADPTPENIAKLSEDLKKSQEEKEKAKWKVRDEEAKSRPDEIMWSYTVEDCGTAECNGVYERSEAFGWRNECPIYVKQPKKEGDKVFSLSREEQPVRRRRPRARLTRGNARAPGR